MTLGIDDIKSIGIIGAGQMGTGIGQVAALAGYDVRLADINAKALDAAVANIIVASNTSSISITRLAASTDRPARFIGMHFMNPVPAMQLVELIRGIATDEATFQIIRALAVKLGKTPVAAEDFPAFIVNRILLPMINEAVYTLYEGVGTVDAIDTAMKLGAHHPMGPLELADFIGLDTCLAVMQVLHEGLADSKYRPCPLLVKYVEARCVNIVLTLPLNSVTAATITSAIKPVRRPYSSAVTPSRSNASPHNRPIPPRIRVISINPPAGRLSVSCHRFGVAGYGSVLSAPVSRHKS